MKNDKTYTVPEIVALCKGKSPEMIKQIIDIKTYIPINEKAQITHSVMKKCDISTKYNVDYDPLRIIVTFMMETIAHYTNIKCSSNCDLESTWNEYDALKSSGLLNSICELIGDDLSELHMVQDVIINHELSKNHIECTVSKWIDNLDEAVHPLLVELTTKIREFETNEFLKTVIKSYMNNN